jgi:hypothetical protein
MRSTSWHRFLFPFRLPDVIYYATDLTPCQYGDCRCTYKDGIIFRQLIMMVSNKDGQIYWTSETHINNFQKSGNNKQTCTGRHGCSGFLHSTCFILRLCLKKGRYFFCELQYPIKRATLLQRLVYKVTDPKYHHHWFNSRSFYSWNRRNISKSRYTHVYICPKTIPNLKESFHIYNSKTSVCPSTSCPKQYVVDQKNTVKTKDVQVGETTRTCQFLR